ncbi:P pilus assembly protein, porin PapC [Enterobacter cancerogenus]|uniref:P pilus assembly protein, porin PapC n=1 Tax=Enterobacter cancerogenus TaxID=69218 RepID=A0A484WWR8_9ENTR|nr:P pilus assembly protein, porin PapC [Enterobacter cancerogenus]
MSPYLTAKGIKTDSRGYAVIPYATPYRVNQVALDVTTVGNDVELENAIVNKNPHRRRAGTRNPHHPPGGKSDVHRAPPQ